MYRKKTYNVMSSLQKNITIIQEAGITINKIQKLQKMVLGTSEEGMVGSS